MATGSHGDGTADPDAVEAERHAFGIADGLRKLPRRGNDPLVSLARNAVEVLASVRGVPAPQWLSGAASVGEGVGDLLAGEEPWLRSASDELLPRYLPALARALAAVDQPGARERITSQALVDVISTIVSARPLLVQDRRTLIFDPAAGTGTLLLRVARSLGPQPVSVYGQDINDDMLAVASANAFLTGIDARFILQDALSADPFPGESFDLAISDPPYGLSWARLGDSLAEDPRYGGGLPHHSDASLLFAQVLISKLRPPNEGGGRAIMLCAPHPLTERSGSSIRAWLLENDLIEAIVALPEGLSSETSIRLFALVLNNSKPERWKGKVQVVDLRSSYVDATGRRPEGRRISDSGLDELRKAIQQPVASAVARPVTLNAFRFDTIDVTHSAVLRPRGSRAALSALVPSHRSLEEWSLERYGVGVAPELSVRTAGGEVRLDVSVVFPDPVDHEVPKEIRRLEWPHVRLVCIATGYAFTKSASSVDRDAELAALPIDRKYLAIPVEAHLDAVVIDSLDSTPDSRCFIVDSDRTQLADLSFVAAWLNSPAGRATRRSAIVRAGAERRGTSVSIRTVSKTQVAQFMDEVLIPVPPLSVQEDVILTSAVIGSAARAVSAASRDLWHEPSNLRQLRRRVQLTNEAEGLAEWASRLPYPLAGTLWVYETAKHDPIRAEIHLIKFWEATSQFLGTVFLSALQADPVLRATEFAALRRALAKVGLSLERATFGTWVAVVQRLAATFRVRLHSEQADTTDKMLHLFADPPIDVLERLFAAEIGRQLGRVNSMRNDWMGHAGATTPAQAREHLDVLLQHTDELRNLLASVWEQYRLVRAGPMRLRSGRFHVQVELARGPTAPFRQREIVLSEPLDEDHLYLTVMDGDRALPLNDLIVLRPAPRSESYTCYFYNRLEASGMRMVTYQYADESSLLDDLPGIRELLADFAGECD